jgi:hypothetical protein
MLETHQFLANTPNIRKMQHITHKEGSRKLSHVQKYNKQAGWPRKGKDKRRSSFSQQVWP